MEIEKIVRLGQVVVFYIPFQKLDSKIYGENDQTPREILDHFLMTHYNAYTLEAGDIEGFWREHPESSIIRDENARYEVSFDGDVEPFVSFLSEVCALIQEQAIYLTMGHSSWLVLPKVKDEI